MFVMLLLNHQAMSVPSMFVAGFAAVATQVAGTTWIARGNQVLSALKCNLDSQSTRRSRNFQSHYVPDVVPHGSYHARYSSQ